MTEANNQIAIYIAENGQTQIDVRVQDETVWLTQESISKLFGTTIPNINIHIKNILNEGELDANSTIKDFLIVRHEGKRKVSRNIVHYNLDMILSVGYRVKSKTATQFRIWATKTLKDYLLNGYVINQKMLAEQKSKFLMITSLLKRKAEI